MELFVIRHAEAVDQRRGLVDAERPLTGGGRERFRKVARGLGRLEIELDLLLHSPLTRAKQTASLLRELVRGEVAETALLTRAPRRELLALFRGDRVGVVGHSPHVGELCAWLVTGKRGGGESFVFKKGAVAWLEGEPRAGKMRLVALLPPQVLRRI
jgi:phosphohistidine phosphatase